MSLYENPDLFPYKEVDNWNKRWEKYFEKERILPEETFFAWRNYYTNRILKERSND